MLVPSSYSVGGAKSLVQRAVPCLLSASSGGRCSYYSQSGNGSGNGGYSQGYGNNYGKSYGIGGYQKSYGNGGYQKSYGYGGYQKKIGNGGYGNGQGYKAGGNGNSFYKKSWSGNKFGGFTKPALPINQFYYTDPQANGKNIRLKLDFGNVVRNPEASGNNPMKLVLTQPAEGDTPAKVNEFSVGWKGAGQILVGGEKRASASVMQTSQALNFRDPEAMSGVEALSAAEGSAEGGSHARIGQNKGHLMIEVTSPEGEPIRCRVPPAQGVAIQALLRYSLPKMVPRTTPIEPSAP